MPAKTAKKRAPKKAKAPKPIGKVTHYYDKINVGIVKLAGVIKLGEVLRFHGKHGEFVQAVTSLQFDHKSITKGAKGKDVGMKVDQPVCEGDLVFRV
ncbi:hypothetical protein HYW83_03310 [Candidatus Peregrinibacteria bacterium]|nr:hypothetical protein [Candidatus Peregrinibacteria bacterium]